MATTEGHRDARFLSLPVDADTVSGTAVLIGSLVGVTLTDEGADGNADGYATVDTGARTGSHRLTVTGALTVGAPVYITSAGALTATATGNTLFGYALEAKGSGDGEVLVKLAAV